MFKSVFVLILFVVIGCTQRNINEENKITRNHIWVKHENSKYSFEYPSDWTLTRNVGSFAEAIHLESHASASIDFSFMILPDTIPGKGYINHMISSINNSRSKLTKNLLLKRNNKIYTDIVYEQSDYVGNWKYEHILFTDGQKTYSLMLCTIEKLTPEQTKKDGARILNSFEVK